MQGLFLKMDLGLRFSCSDGASRLRLGRTRRSALQGFFSAAWGLCGRFWHDVGGTPKLLDGLGPTGTSALPGAGGRLWIENGEADALGEGKLPSIGGKEGFDLQAVRQRAVQSVQ